MTFLKPSVHVVKETPAAKLFRRRVHCPDILTFFSLETGQWILAYWISRKIRLVDEIEDLGANFELLNSELVNQISHCWGPVDWKAKKNRLISKLRDQERERDDTIVEHQERYNWLKEKMKRPIPYAFKSPISGGQAER